jgi:hypothetical protein
MGEVNMNEQQSLVDLYEEKLQGQTAIIFALVGKLGGEVLLTKEDLTAFPEFNTVMAVSEEEALKLMLKYEEG